MSAVVHAQPLARHQWQHRVVLVFAQAPTSPAIEEQLAVLRQQQEGLAERDLVIYRVGTEAGIKPSGKKLLPEDVVAFRQKYAADQPDFRFVLLGKDATEKWRTDEQASVEELFARIDRMPMRRAEMRRQKKDDGG